MSNKLSWVSWSLAAIGAIAFAATLPVAVRKPAIVEKVIEKKVEVPVEVLKITTNTITFTNEIPVTVEKIVEVPAEIPPAYRFLRGFRYELATADLVTNSYDALKGISTLKVAVDLGRALTRVIGEESARSCPKMRLTFEQIPCLNTNNALLVFA